MIIFQGGDDGCGYYRNMYKIPQGRNSNHGGWCNRGGGELPIQVNSKCTAKELLQYTAIALDRDSDVLVVLYP
jgi:hypothetical protein